MLIKPYEWRFRVKPGMRRGEAGNGNDRPFDRLRDRSTGSATGVQNALRPGDSGTAKILLYLLINREPHNEMKRLILNLSIPLLLSLAFSCGDGNKTEPQKSVTSVTLNQSSLTLVVGESSTLSSTVSPADAPDKTVSWTSSNASVASVSNGVVKAVSEGTATITASCGGKSASCTVTVQKKTIPVASVTLKPTSLTLIQGESATLTLTISPADATEQTATWSSSNPLIVTVADGKVTAVREGTATITASCGGKSAECAVMVSNNTTGNNEGTGDENWD